MQSFWSSPARGLSPRRTNQHFAGVGAAENDFLQYWEDYGKYAMDNAPDNVKRGSETDKASYVTARVGDKAADLKIKPNVGLLLDRADRMRAPGGVDRGSCGDTTNWLARAFKGAGIQGIVPVEANKAGLLSNRSENKLDVNREQYPVYWGRDQGQGLDQ